MRLSDSVADGYVEWIDTLWKRLWETASHSRAVERAASIWTSNPLENFCRRWKIFAEECDLDDQAIRDATTSVFSRDFADECLSTYNIRLVQANNSENSPLGVTNREQFRMELLTNIVMVTLCNVNPSRMRDTALESLHTCMTAFEDTCVQYRLASPIFGLVATQKSTDVGDGVSVTRYDDEARSLVSMISPTPLWPGTPMACIKSTCRVHKRITDLWRLDSHHFRIITDLIDSLRLECHGPIGAPIVVCIPEFGYSGMPSVRHHGCLLDQHAPRWNTGSRPFDSIDSNEQRINQTRLALSSDRVRLLDHAIRAFSSSIGRNRIEDRIVDLVIALEGTVLHGCSDELKYRAWVRSAVAAHRQFEPKEVQQIIKWAYDIRSDIVHNGATVLSSKYGKKLPDNTVADSVQKLEDIVRFVIKYFISQASEGKSPDHIVAELDSRLLQLLSHAQDGPAGSVGRTQ